MKKSPIMLTISGLFKSGILNSALLSFGLLIFSLNADAAEQYRGMVSASIVESNGYVYIGDEGFENGGVFEDKQIIYFSQERGQKLTMNKQNIVFDTSRNKKYHLILEIIERKGEKFKAKVSFYQNAMGHADANPSIVASSALISKVIKSAEIEGLLNTDNRYAFIDDDKANLNLSINIDRIFSEQEIRQRLKKQLENESGSGLSLF